MGGTNEPEQEQFVQKMTIISLDTTHSELVEKRDTDQEIEIKVLLP